MHILRIFVALFATLLLGAVAVAAQDTGWVLIAVSGAGDTHALLTITPEGVTERVALPADFPASYEQLALSPDGRLLATIPARSNRVFIIDVGADECCTEYVFSEDEVFLSTLAGFSPDGTQLAISFVVEEPAHSAMILLDVETGEIPTYIDMTPPIPDPGSVLTYPILLDWRDDGIRFVTSCIMCVDATMPGNLSLWNTATGAVGPTDGFYDYRNDMLAATSSRLQPVYALDYPSAADAEAIFWGAQAFGARNAVVLYGPEAENENAIVYADDEHFNLIARWVADGDAFIVFFSNDIPGSGELVLPDGGRQPVDHPASQLLAGTPDGWVRNNNGALTHYRLHDGALVTTDLGEYSGAISVVRAPALGADGGSAFPTVPPPEPVTCDGFVQSRLVVGHLGRVLPGPANNMRAEPTTTSPIIAKIAGAEPFAILEGPVCNQGLAWWRVEFNHQEGWTAEGSGTAYWLENAPDMGYRAPSQPE